MSLSLSNRQPSLQFHSRPMAISTITSPPLASSHLLSPNPFFRPGTDIPTLASSDSSPTSSSSSTCSSTSPPPIQKAISVRSPRLFAPNYGPTDQETQMTRSYRPENIHRTSIPPSHRHGSHAYAYSPLQRTHNHNQASPQPMASYASDSSSNSSPCMTPLSPSSPLSLQERRQRNKAASAKYRAKKNQQHGEMRSLIDSITKENDLLSRQLDHAQRENSRLKATCDRLRGKMLAEKMLKRLLGQDKQHPNDPKHNKEDEVMSMADPSECYFQNHSNQASAEQHQRHQRMAVLERFDEDIDFEDDVDEEDKNQAWSTKERIARVSPEGKANLFG